MSVAGTDIFVLRNDTYIDISNVFDELKTGMTNSGTTDIYANGIDINNLYRILPSLSNEPKAATTDIYLNTGKDLSATFAKKKPYITDANIEILDSAEYYFMLFTNSTSNGTQTGYVTLNGFTTSTSVKYLVIGGGGAGGDGGTGTTSGGGGGGGAGGMLEGTISVNPYSIIVVSVGAGGVANNTGTRANGKNSTITYNTSSSIIALGGGGGGIGGGIGTNSISNRNGNSGGSGGGGGWSGGEGGAESTGQGNNGNDAVNNGGGGGGGAGPTVPSGKNGRAGKRVSPPFLSLNVNGKNFDNIHWAGGGSGGAQEGANGTGADAQDGAVGGGGAGGAVNANAGNGSGGDGYNKGENATSRIGGNGGDNTGGGGGGGGPDASGGAARGGSGGSGIVILAIPKIP